MPVAPHCEVPQGPGAVKLSDCVFGCDHVDDSPLLTKRFFAVIAKIIWPYRRAQRIRQALDVESCLHMTHDDFEYSKQIPIVFEDL